MDLEAVKAAPTPELVRCAVDEAGKAVGLSTLAVMPVSLQAQAPVGRMLEWHQLKLVGGMMITAVPVGTFAVQLAAMSPSQVAGIVEDAQVLAQDVDRRLYADIDRSGQVRLPSEVTEADVAVVLNTARKLREQTPASDAKASSGRERRGRDRLAVITAITGKWVQGNLRGCQFDDRPISFGRETSRETVGSRLLSVTIAVVRPHGRFDVAD